MSGHRNPVHDATGIEYFVADTQRHSLWYRVVRDSVFTRPVVVQRSAGIRSRDREKPEQVWSAAESLSGEGASIVNSIASRLGLPLDKFFGPHRARRRKLPALVGLTHHCKRDATCLSKTSALHADHGSEPGSDTPRTLSENAWIKQAHINFVKHSWHRAGSRPYDSPRCLSLWYEWAHVVDPFCSRSFTSTTRGIQAIKPLAISGCGNAIQRQRRPHHRGATMATTSMLNDRTGESSVSA